MMSVDSSSLERAIQLLEDGKLRRAEKAFLRMLREDARDLDAHFNLARIYRRLRDLPKALAHARLVLRMSPQEPNANLNLGLICEQMGRFRSAVKYYRRELERDPYSRETLFNIGHLYFARRRWRRASEYLQRCFDTGYSFDLERLVYNLSTCYYHRREVEKYIDLYRRYVAKVPDAGWAIANLGDAMLYAGDVRAGVLKLELAKRLGAGKSAEAGLGYGWKLLRQMKLS